MNEYEFLQELQDQMTDDITEVIDVLERDGLFEGMRTLQERNDKIFDKISDRKVELLTKKK